MRGHRVHDGARTAIVEEQLLESKSPERRGSKFITFRFVIEDSISKTFAHCMEAEVAEHPDGVGHIGHVTTSASKRAECCFAIRVVAVPRWSLQPTHVRSARGDEFHVHFPSGP